MRSLLEEIRKFDNIASIELAEQFMEVGDFVSGSFCNEPSMIIKTEAGDLKAYYNVCRHHAAELLHGAGCTREIVCPCHAWAYALDGKLKKAPQMAGIKSFQREELSLGVKRESDIRYIFKWNECPTSLGFCHNAFLGRI